jgi:hypothetical protein
MKRIQLLSAALVLAALAALPGAAQAKIVELGQTTTPITQPACPKGASLNDCRILLTRTTSIQTSSDGVKNPYKVTKAGWLVAFTAGVSNMVSSSKERLTLLHSLDSRYGGVPQLILTVLKPGPKNTYTVVSQSGAFHLIPFLGQVLQEPLSMPNDFKTFAPLAVTPGEVIGLTVPTWAPLLAYPLSDSKFSYRQSRRANCLNTPTTQTAQTTVGAKTTYGCAYTGARVEFTVTEVTNTPYPKKYVHGTRR